MIHRLLSHVRGNVVAYIALMVAVVSGGGGYAVAATTHKTTKSHKKKPTTIVACVTNKTSQMYLHHGTKRCPKGRHKVTWAIAGKPGARGKTGKTGAPGAPGSPGAPGAPGSANAAFATVGPDAPDATSGLTAKKEPGLGSWLITVTNPACAHTRNVMVVSPTNDQSRTDPLAPDNATPVVSGVGSGTQFTVQTGYSVNGSFVEANYEFNAIIECGATPAQ